MNCSDFILGQYYRRTYSLTKRAIVFRVVKIRDAETMEVQLVHSPLIQFLTPYDVGGHISWITERVKKSELVWELL